MPVGEIRALEEKVGKRGPYTRVQFDRWYSAFGKQHDMLSTASVGDMYEYAVVQKGDFFNLVDLKASDGSATSAPAMGSQPTQRSTFKKDDSFNRMMALSYAKDLVVADKASSLDDGLKMLKESFDSFTESLASPQQ